MKSVDFRKATFAELHASLSGSRERVLAAWRQHGPCTTKELAARSGIDVLTVRPRTHDLEALGFVRLHEVQPSTTEGTYRAATPAEALRFFSDQQRLARGEAVQPELALHGV